MKTLKFIVVSLLMFSIVSCEKDDDVLNESLHKANLQSLTESEVEAKAGFIEYQVSPTFGKPNSTNFVFRVSDPIGANALSVKFFERATGAVNYVPMVRVGSEWKLTKQVINNGWFDYRYVYSGSNANISANAYELCATDNVFSSTGTSKIKWPFGADGSSFTNRLGWIGPRETGGCGSGWNMNGHIYQSCYADDSYAEDWNKDCGNSYADDGAEVKSPLDGKVIKVTVDSPSNHHGGYGNSIDIEQVTANGTYVFRIAHLKYAPPPSVPVGAWVKAGYTKIGNVGMTGGTSTAPHAHIVLYKKNSCYVPMKFSLNAN